MRNRFSVLIFTTLLIIPVVVFGYQQLTKPNGYVADFAGVLNNQQTQNLNNKLSQYEQSTTNQIAVVTIKSLGGDYIENYAVKLFQDWGIGQKGKDNGILFLISVDDRQMRIEVGYGLEGVLTDLQSKQIIDNIAAPAFRQNDYYDGIDRSVDAIISAVSGDHSATTTQTQAPFQNVGINFTWIFFFAIIVLNILGKILGSTKSWWLGGVLGGIGGIIVGLIWGFLYAGVISLAVLIPFGLLIDFLLSRSYTRSRAAGKFPWWWFIGGGRGGSGSGGGGFGGGGFGGFGGGSSGGGGASGGW